MGTETYTPTLDPTLYHRSEGGRLVASLVLFGFLLVLIYAPQKGECSKAGMYFFLVCVVDLKQKVNSCQSWRLIFLGDGFWDGLRDQGGNTVPGP